MTAGGYPLIGRQGTTESVTLREDRATAPFEDICHRAIPALFTASWYTKAVRDVAQVEYGSRDLHWLERRGRHEVR